MKNVNKQQEKEIIEKYFNQNKSSVELSKEYGFSEVTICKVLKRNGYAARDKTQSNRKYSIREDYFDSIDTEEKAYIMGLLYADGYNDTSRNSVNLSLKESDKQILEDITKIIQPDKPLQFIKIKKPNCENQYRLVIANKHISQKIAEYGCMKAKTFLVEFPSWLNEDLYNHFIRGYIDGDGWIGKKSICIVGTEKFLDKISEICYSKFGFNTYKRKRHKHRNHNIYMLDFSGRKKCLQFLSWIYDDATIYLQRKMNASLNLKQIYTESSSGIQACGDGSSSLSETTSVSPSAKQEFNKKSRVYILKV
jgi:hypothetical protein